MSRKERSLWKRVRQFVIADPTRFAGGSALTETLGLLAIEEQRLSDLRRSQAESAETAAEDKP
jgi:hypothetical protein